MKSIETVLLDTNIILRFFRQDHTQQFIHSKQIFKKAEAGQLRCYIDDVIIAEAVWTLASFYKTSRTEIASKLEALIAQPWMIGEKKEAVLTALRYYQSTSLDYIDCWLLSVSKLMNIRLISFDKKLKRYEKE